MRSSTNVQLHVDGVTLDPRDGRAIVVMRSPETSGVFPLWVGDAEAAAIARCLHCRSAPPSSDTHSLLVAALRALGARVEHVELTGVVAGVVVAEVSIADAAGSSAMSARASDALVLAMEFGAPILIHQGLLAQIAARVVDAEERTASRAALAQAPSLTHAERWSQLLAQLSSSRSPQSFEG